MSYEQASHVAQTWGLVVLAACFVGAVIYALWPGNREKFNKAAALPLNEESDDDQ